MGLDGATDADTTYRRGLVKLLAPVVLLAVAAVVAVIVLLTSARDHDFTLTAHEWRREVAVETLTALDESEWCDRMPPDATKVSRRREIQRHREVRDGETCRDVQVESSGRTTTRRECRERIREEPVYADRCAFTVNRWRVTRTERAKGPRSQEPRWPPVTIRSDVQGLGAEREGPRKERFVVVIRDGKDSRAETECDLERSHWAVLPTEGPLEGDVAVLTRKVDCASLQAP